MENNLEQNSNCVGYVVFGFFKALFGGTFNKRSDCNFFSCIKDNEA